jgi:hypothetical protein
LRPLPWILIVLDDDADHTRDRLASAVETRLPGHGVRATGDGDEAMRLIGEPGLALLLTVEESAGVDGLVLAACGRRQNSELPVILLSDLHGRRSSFGRRGVHWLPRKLPLLRLVEQIARLLDPPSVFRGELTLPSFLELVRVLCAANASGALSVRQGAASGTVWLEYGSVVHALTEGVVGVEAFHVMLRWKGGAFAFADGTPPERTIAMPADQLMRECARFLDREQALARGSSPGLSSMAASHFRRAIELINRGHHAEALEEMHQAAHLDLENRTYREHLARLRKRLGLAGA